MLEQATRNSKLFQEGKWDRGHCFSNETRDFLKHHMEQQGFTRDSMTFHTLGPVHFTHFWPRRVGWNEVYKWSLAEFLVLYVWTSSTWVNILANNSGDISLLNFYMNKPMAYMYNDFKGMIFNSEYNVTVFVRGVTPAIKRTALFCIFYQVVEMDIVGFTPNMDTVIKIRQYQWVVQWK